MPQDNDLHRLEDDDVPEFANFDDWEEDPDPPVVAPPRGTMISLRLDQDTASLVRRAARTQGLSQSEFVRRAAIEAAEKATWPEPIRIQIPPGANSMVRYEGNTWIATMERTHATMVPVTNPQKTIYAPLRPDLVPLRHVAGNTIRSISPASAGGRRQRRPHGPSGGPRQRRSR